MTPKIKSLIIEDDKRASDYLSSILIDNFSQIDIVGYSDCVKDSIQLIDNLKPEIVFMDIVLTDGTAFQILDQINYHDFEIIFITSHEEYLKKAMEQYNALYYTSKPVSFQKIGGVLNRYDNLKKRFFSLNKYQLFSEFIKDRNSKFLIHINHQFLAISIDDILKCEADGNYTNFYLADKKKHLASKSLKYYENLLMHKGFFKANRSTIVNILHIKSIYKNETIILKNDDKIIISRRNKVNILELIKRLS